MSYEKLSNQMENLTNPQRSDAFYRQFRDAVRQGEVEAADLPERFELPKAYRRRGVDETYTRTVKDMVVNVTPAYKKWFDGVNAALGTPARRAAPKASLEAVEAGHVDFAAMVEETRRKMQSSFEKGQNLGNSRKAAKSAPKARRTTKK